jgi:CBS domain containing-hemolysin-like protein
MLLAVEMTTGDTVMLVVVLALLFVSAALAIAETALTRVSRSKAAALVEEGRPGARQLQALVEHPERFLNPVLLVVSLCQLVQASLTGILADRLFGTWGVVVAMFVNVGVVFVIAESAPKTWALQHPERSALLSARPIGWLVAFAPLRLVARGLIGLTNVILPGKGLKDGPFVSEEEILALADVAVEEDVIEEGERVLIESIIEFGDTVAREVMVPRPDMVAVPVDFRVADVMEVAILNGYSRIPAFGEGIDDIVGLIYAKDLMKADRDGLADAEVSTLLRTATFVPETKRIAELLREMQAEAFHMAIVVDEYGGTAGVVTLEDLIEELVGEIVDEYDREEPMVEPAPGGGIRVNARLPVDELNDLLDARLPEGDWDSVGGLVFHLFGRVAHEGAAVEVDGFELKVDRLTGRRISRVVVTRLAVPDAGGDAAPSASDDRGTRRRGADTGATEGEGAAAASGTGHLEGDRR